MHFLPFLPASLSRTLEKLFEKTRHPSWALDLPRALLPGLLVRCVTLDPEVPGKCEEQPTQTLIVRLLKTHFIASKIGMDRAHLLEF